MRKLSFIVLFLLLSGCGAASLDDYSNTRPELKLEQFFDGKLKAYGIVLDRSGKLLRRFDVDLVASWDGDQGEIKEWFLFDDGEKSTRIWRLSKVADNQYQGQADDVIGIATGNTEGAALFWQYDLDIVVDGETYRVTLDDWMFLLDEKRLFNKTEMTKFGFKVGEVILYIEKRED
ncbi:DUF3833 domain-containing protein [Shewanella mesophila]|uniref:DUF3833 domain-containing protein n=1 Tax=Shewanella mesophila TaxID=2864208 RepID=UPI001C65F142|nr:DUF3833 domain-containing protein [Shewanella mesophila]QYJ84925.1 DUF3833 domain-containing protein [Shewanella mesophila]